MTTYISIVEVHDDHFLCECLLQQRVNSRRVLFLSKSKKWFDFSKFVNKGGQLEWKVGP